MAVIHVLILKKYECIPGRCFIRIVAKFSKLTRLIAVGASVSGRWISANAGGLCSHAGMLALEMLGRRAHNDHPNNFSRSPPYTEDVKWLLGLAARLGNSVIS